MATAAPREAHARTVAGVPVGVADIETSEHPLGARLISSEDGGAETELRFGEARQRLVVVAHALHADHRAERLVAHHVHTPVDVDEHGRLEPVAGPVNTTAATHDLRALGLR